jgi:hypothetical protein
MLNPLVALGEAGESHNILETLPEPRPNEQGIVMGVTPKTEREHDGYRVPHDWPGNSEQQGQPADTPQTPKASCDIYKLANEPFDKLANEPPQQHGTARDQSYETIRTAAERANETYNPQGSSAKPPATVTRFDSAPGLHNDLSEVPEGQIDFNTHMTGHENEEKKRQGLDPSQRSRKTVETLRPLTRCERRQQRRRQYSLRQPQHHSRRTVQISGQRLLSREDRQQKQSIHSPHELQPSQSLG